MGAAMEEDGGCRMEDAIWTIMKNRDRKQRKLITPRTQCADIEFSSKAVAPSTDICFNSTGVGAEPLNYGASTTNADKATATPAKTNAAEIVVPGISFVAVAAAGVAALMV